ncbi:hypothetical protein Tco_0627949 [Tanacetum coccineum]|uniref:Uncharacterized protein n=1 Tax=Tanacetum coccineum TaxID=301880 RepID=A0ABQ4WNV5_9ASTR
MRNLRGGENISSLDLPELTPVIDESTLLVTLPSPYLVVLGDEKIDLLLRDDLDTLSTGDREIDFNPSRDIEELERLLADDPVPVPRVFDEPLGPPHRLPLLDPLKRFALGKWISYDLEDLRACFQFLPNRLRSLISSLILNPFVEIPSGESKVHVEVLSVLWGNRLPIPDGLLPLSSRPLRWRLRLFHRLSSSYLLFCAFLLSGIRLAADGIIASESSNQLLLDVVHYLHMLYDGREGLCDLQSATKVCKYTFSELLVIFRGLASTHFVECLTTIDRNFKFLEATGRGPKILIP